MSRIAKLWKIVYLIFINVFIAIFLLVIVDGAITTSYFQHNAKKYGNPADQMTCNSRLTGYDYCASLVQINFMDKRDKLLPVYNFINSERKSDYKNKEFRPIISKDSKIYVVGDSFIQADELPIVERFEHLLRVDGYDVIAYGYSSWNSWQFSKIAEKLPVRSGDKVMIFSMTNDYTPSYGNSTIQVIQNSKITEANDEQSEVKDKSLINDYIGQSFLLNRVLPDAALFFKSFMDRNSTQVKKINDIKPYIEPACELVKEQSVGKLAVAYDYISLSLDSKCWSLKMVESVDLNIAMLKGIKKTIENQGAQVDFFLVPAGWAFKNQNTVGRLTEPYNFSRNISISHAGLSNYINSKGLQINDLTQILESHSTRDDDLYFPVDGHWTSHSHKIVYDYLKSNFLNKN